LTTRCSNKISSISTPLLSLALYYITQTTSKIIWFPPYSKGNWLLPPNPFYLSQSPKLPHSSSRPHHHQTLLFSRQTHLPLHFCFLFFTIFYLFIYFGLGLKWIIDSETLESCLHGLTHVHVQKFPHLSSCREGCFGHSRKKFSSCWTVIHTCQPCQPLVPLRSNLTRWITSIHLSLTTLIKAQLAFNTELFNSHDFSMSAIGPHH
jgi:hypothetical protein